MTNLEQISLMNLPNEIIEVVTSFLSFEELMRLTRVGNKRLEEVAKRTLKRNSYIAIIGGYNNGYLDDVEVVSIKKDSISIINSTIPSLPKGLGYFRGTQLPDHDLLVSGGWRGSVKNNEYLRFSQDSNQWKKVGTIKMARYAHSSVLLNGCLYSCGGDDSSGRVTSHHEVLNMDGRVEEKKELPIALGGHTANKLNDNQYMVIGGRAKNYKISQKCFIYDVRSDEWKEGPSLKLARTGHCSCIIQSDDGTQDSIIIIGGWTNQGRTNTTEIFNINQSKWTEGPNFPCGIISAACVPLPPTMKSVSNISCVVVGGSTDKGLYSSEIYGLDRTMTKWTHLGKIKKGRESHIVLPLS